jgi:holo-[acyl-carrier protein] synthase
MEIAGIGIDIVELGRIEAIDAFERFAEMVLSPHEQEQLSARKDKVEFMASRFAAKEAVIKAFPLTVTAQDFEILKDGVRPQVHFFNPLHHGYRVHVSLSHSTQFAAGCAVVQKI